MNLSTTADRGLLLDQTVYQMYISCIHKALDNYIKGIGQLHNGSVIRNKLQSNTNEI